MNTGEVKVGGYDKNLELIKEYSRSRFFIASLISAIVLTVIYIFASAAMRRRMAKRTRRYKF